MKTVSTKKGFEYHICTNTIFFCLNFFSRFIFEISHVFLKPIFIYMYILKNNWWIYFRRRLKSSNFLFYWIYLDIYVYICTMYICIFTTYIHSLYLFSCDNRNVSDPEIGRFFIMSFILKLDEVTACFGLI